MNNSPTLHTPRLTLRRFTADDAGAFFETMGDEAVTRYLPWTFHTLEEARAALEEQYLAHYEEPTGLRYAICLTAGDIPIGYVSINFENGYELGYGLRQDHWHQGIITEAARAILEEARRQGLPWVMAIHDRNNPNSGLVMQKLGMTYRYSYQEQWQPKDILVTFRLYQIDLDGENPTYQKGAEPHFIEENI